MRRYLVEQLADIYRQHGPERIIVLVPTRQVGYNIARWLAASGTNHANLEFHSTASLAESVVDRYGPPIWLADRDDLRLAAAQALQVVSSRGDFYFGRSTGAGFIAATARSLSALRDAGIGPNDVREAGQTGSRRDKRRAASVARLLDAYRGALNERGLTDAADLYQLATTLATRNNYTAGAALCVLDEVIAVPAAEAFVRAVAPDHLFRVGADQYDFDLPQLAAARVLSDWPACDLSGYAEPSAPTVGLRLGATSEGAEGSSRIAVFTAPAPEREVQGVLGDIVASGIPFEQCELVYTKADYLTIIEASAIAAGVPCEFGQGRPAVGTAVGQALFGFYGWLAGGRKVVELIDLLSVRCLKFSDREGRFVAPDAVGELLRRHASGRGVEAYAAALRQESHPEARRRAANAAQALSLFLEDTSVEETTTVGDVASAGLRLLDTYLWRQYESESARTRDGAACASLTERLRRLEDERVAMPISSAARFVMAMVSDHRYATSSAAPGAIYVVPLEAASYSGRAHTFVVGLDEHSFPGSQHEDPLVLDHERVRLSPALPLLRSESSRRIFRLERALRGAGEAVTLVGRGLDLIYGKRIELSPVVTAFCERRGLTIGAYGLVPAPTSALSDADLLLSQRETVAFKESVAGQYPGLVAGYEAERLRHSPGLNEWSGFLGHATPELSLRAGATLSASRLETLAACPYRYFVRNVLKVYPPDEPRLQPGQWLEAREIGSVLHELYYRFMTELQNRGERASVAAHEELLMDTLDTLLQERADTRTAPGVAAVESDRNRLERSAMVFLRDEEHSLAEPVAFELEFGHDDAHPPLPVALSEDVTLTLRGSIDRVNRVSGSANEYEVWDYKTGRAIDFENADLRSTVQHLQWMLYAYAFEEMDMVGGGEVSVSRSGYLFVNDREHGRRMAETVPPRSFLADALRPLFVMAEMGAFPHYQKKVGGGSWRASAKGACQFCDYREVCSDERRTVDDINSLTVFDREPDVGQQLIAWVSGGGQP